MALSANARFAYDYFRRNGLSDVAAAGLVGTLMGESGQGLDTSSYNPDDPGGAYGVLQATGGSGRAQSLAAYQDPNAKSELERQLSYILNYELRGSEKKSGERFQNARSLEDSTAAGLGYLRPADQAVGGENYNRRLGYAQGVLNAGGSAPSPAASAYNRMDLSPYVAKGKTIEGSSAQLQERLSYALAAMPEDVRKSFMINSGFRTPEQQQVLWDKSDKSGHMVARPGHSQHGMGNAFDIQKGAAQQWLHEHGAEYGLKFPMSWEPWHIETAETRGGQAFNAPWATANAGGAAPGVISADGTPAAPVVDDGGAAAGFQEAVDFQQKTQAMQNAQAETEAAQQQAAQAQQQAAAAQQQQAAAAPQMGLGGVPGAPAAGDQGSAASLMAGLLDRKRQARAGPVPGVLNAWSV